MKGHPDFFVALEINKGGIPVAQSTMSGEVLANRKPPSRWVQFKSTLGAWGFMAPAGVLVLIFFFIPVLILFVLSLTDLSSSNFSEPLTFIGLENYFRMFSDRFFPKILGNTLFYVRGHGVGDCLADDPHQPQGGLLLPLDVAAAAHYPLGGLYPDVAAYCPTTPFWHY
jgi:hypothetical protein